MKLKYWIYIVVAFIPVFVYNATILAFEQTVEDCVDEIKRLNKRDAIQEASE